MALRREKLLVSTLTKDSENQIKAEYVWYSKSGAPEQLPKLYLQFGYPESENYQKRFHLSDIDVVYSELNRAVSDRNPASLKKILTTNFICEFKSSYEIGNLHTKGLLETYLICTVHPNIEALLAYKLEYFLELLDLLIQANNQDLYAAFFASLENTDLSDKKLFCWNNAIKNNLYAKLAELHLYGDLRVNSTFMLDEIERQNGLAALDFTLGSYDTVQNRPTEELEDNLTPQQKIEHLKFKLSMVNDLTKLDKQFSMDTNIKRIVVNMCAILFTAGIANLIFYLANRFYYQNSGDLLFFNRTNSQKLADEVHVALGFEPPSVAFK